MGRGGAVVPVYFVNLQGLHKVQSVSCCIKTSQGRSRDMYCQEYRAIVCRITMSVVGALFDASWLAVALSP